MSLELAREIARRKIDLEGEDGYVITKEEPVEFGFLFFFTTKKYIETGDLVDAVFGGGPLFIHNDMERVFMLPSYQPYEETMKELNQTYRAEAEGRQGDGWLARLLSNLLSKTRSTRQEDKN